MDVIAVAGATGYIGQRLLASLVCRDDVQVRALVHRGNVAMADGKGVSVISGDIREPSVLRELIAPGCTVINLAYLPEGSVGENIQAAIELADACAEAGIRRLVHCSTVDVVGRVPDTVVTEETPCNPVNDYQKAKHSIEQVLLERYSDRFPVTILRPSMVFGPHSRRPLAVAQLVKYGSGMRNYLKSCLFGYRRLNLVYIDNVVAALEFLVDIAGDINKQVFIISDDEYEGNNYRRVEAYLMRRFGRGRYPVPQVRIPVTVLAACLRVVGKSTYNPCRVYSCRKIQQAGLKKPVPFDDGLAAFAVWYEDSPSTAERDRL